MKRARHKTLYFQHSIRSKKDLENRILIKSGERARVFVVFGYCRNSESPKCLFKPNSNEILCSLFLVKL